MTKTGIQALEHVSSIHSNVKELRTSSSGTGEIWNTELCFKPLYIHDVLLVKTFPHLFSSMLFRNVLNWKCYLGFLTGEQCRHFLFNILAYYYQEIPNNVHDLNKHVYSCLINIYGILILSDSNHSIHWHNNLNLSTIIYNNSRRTALQYN